MPKYKYIFDNKRKSIIIDCISSGSIINSATLKADMTDNPKLKHRSRNPNRIRKGSMWQYWPTSISRNEDIKLGTELVILEKPSKTAVPIVKVALIERSEPMYGKEDMGQQVTSYKHHPDFDNVYHVLVSDLTKGKY